MNMDRMIKKMNLYSEKQQELKGMTEEELNQELLNVINDIEATQDNIKVLQRDYERNTKINKIVLENYRMVEPKYEFEKLDEYWELKLEQAKEKYRDEESMARNTIKGMEDYVKYVMGLMQEIEKHITKKKRNG